MELYYAPGACSRASHIVLREIGAPFDLTKVDLRAKKTAGGDDFLAINDKGLVPVLKLDDGAVLTENGAVLQYLGDQKPDAKLVPAPGTMERYRLQEWLSFIGADVHKTIGNLFRPIPEETKKAVLERAAQWLGFLDKHLADQPFLMGETFTVADAYAYVVLSWTTHLKVDISPYPNVQAYLARIAERPAVQAAIAAES